MWSGSQDAESEPSFLADVIADGRVLVDREGLWPRLRSREAEPATSGSPETVGAHGRRSGRH